MSDSINVSIKVRPLIKREKDENLTIQWAVQGNSIVSTDPDMKKRGDGKFQFDHIFDMDVTNLNVFDTIVKPIVDAAINGFNGTVFAYGQTSSGKTYTMMGTMEEPGVVPLAIEHLFGAIANTTGREFLLRVSYLEIHKERVNDLLNKANVDLKLHEDSTGQVILKCREEITNSAENLLSIMQKGEKNRRIGETNMNERSSRSHTIFRITIESREADADSDGAIQVSQLNLVDLAGSERARQTGATGERFEEGRCINKSLSTLGLVIMQLSESQENQKHVNFRDSKLTRLLQSSLGGNAMTAIICAVTPAALEETQCTLSFASRAKSVKNKPQLNEVMSDAALLKRYARQLAKLENELSKLKSGTRAAEVEEMESKLLEKDRMNQLLEERIELLKTRILSGAIRNDDESLACKSRRRTWCGPTTFKQRFSVFDTDSLLPTIKEMSPEKVCTRKSIMQRVDIMNQTFQTEFADFEIELIESERDRENDSDEGEELFITKRRYGRRVKFMDDVQTKRDSINITPEKREISTQTIRGSNNDQTSPSTPKDVLRKTICELSKDYRELQEFSILEKQVFCEENQCQLRCVDRQLFPEYKKYDRKIAETQTDIIQHEVDKYIMEESMKIKRQVLDIPDIKEQLNNFGLNGENNFQRILTQLCVKLKEAEREKVSRNEANKKMSKKYSELETQLKNITSERNEYEFMNRELRTEANKKRTELELNIMAQKDAEELTKEKILQMEKEIETITADKIKLEHINSELRKKNGGLEIETHAKIAENREMAKRIVELEEQVEIATLQTEKPKTINNDLCNETNVITEVESKSVSELTSNEDVKRISSMEEEIERITSKNNDLQNINSNLHTELQNKISECELKIEKIAELEKLMDQITSEKSRYEEINQQLHTELSKKATDLDEQIEKFNSKSSEVQNIDCKLRTELQNKISECEMKNTKISELEEEIKNIAAEKCELQRINQDLHTELNKISTEIETKTVPEIVTNEDVTKQISVEQQIEKITSERNELETIIHELRTELQNKISECELNVNKITELEKQIEIIISERNEFENSNCGLKTESELIIAKMSELEKQIEKITSERNEFENVNRRLQTECESNAEKISELEKQIEHITSRRNEFENVNHKLRSECESNVQKISELEKQIENITFERNEFENVSRKLRTECESNIEKISGLEKQREHITSERNEFENNNCGLKTGSELINEKISELEKQTEKITSERNEFENVNRRLQIECESNAEKISELEKQIEKTTSERNEFENVNCKLRIECESSIQKISELKNEIENITSERNEFENVNCKLRSEFESNAEKVLELEKQIKTITSEKSELEHIRAELSKKALDLESKIISVEVESEERKAKIVQLEQNTQNLTAQKVNLEDTTRELRTQFESMINKISEFERQTEDAVSKKLEFERNYTELSNELAKNISELESKVSLGQTENQEARKKIAELEEHIESITSERNDFERQNCEVRLELDKKGSKLELTMEQMLKLEKQIEEFTLQKNELSKDDDKSNNKIENLESKAECHSVTETNNLNSLHLQGEQTKQTMLPPVEMNESNEDSSGEIFNLKEENIKLTAELESKVQEVEEIKNDVKGLKEDIENLQKTIYLLTAENMDMSMKLSTEKDYSKDVEVNLQKKIDDLYARVSKVTEEKNDLEGDSTDINKKLGNVRSSMSDDEELLYKYQSKIDRLTEENIELSAIVAEKIRELEDIKESKSLLFDHECIYKDNVARLAEKNESLMSENNELSSDLMDRIEENDMLKEECDGLKKKLEVFITKATNSDESNIEQLRSENSMLIGEITELKAKLTTLSEENAKLTNNLLETIEDLDNSRSRRSHNKSLSLSMILDDSKLVESSDEVSNESNHDVLVDEVTKLRDKVNHLTRLNKKLCDLKLTTCSQCTHLSNLKESHRSLKIETKILNHKLEELQKNFELKCAQSEAIKLKADQELNSSLCDISFNSSFTDGLNVSFVEEKVQHLNNELQILKNHHDKLSVLYKEKCSELEKLNVANAESSCVKNNSKLKEQGHKMDVKIDQIQKCIDGVKNDIDDMKKNNSSFNLTLYKFKGEKESLLNEIRMLQRINEELKEKISSSEISVTTATEKVQIYENELSLMSKQVEQFSLKEKANDTERLNLEVELECLKTEKEAKDVIIGELHRTIDELNQCVSTLRNELDSMTSQRNDLAVSMENSHRRYLDELEMLQKQNKDLEEKIKGTEAKEEVISTVTELKKDIEMLQMSLTQQESLCNDLQNNVSNLQGLLEESNSEKISLKKDLETLKIESSNSLRMAEEKYKSEMNSVSKEFKEHEEIKFQEINQRLSKCIEENNTFKEALAKLQDIEKDFNKVKEENEDLLKERRKLIEESKRLCEDLNGVKECILQELKSLRGKANVANFLEKPAKEIYTIFLQTLMSKEEDVIKAMRQQFEKDKQKVVEEKQQCADAEKRMTLWVKELEMENDKLQTDLTKREFIQREHQEKIYQLEHALKESNHDKEIFKEEVNTLEAELFKLRTEFDKQCKMDHQQEAAAIIAQKKEKEAQEVFRSKEIELQLKMTSEKDNYEKQIDNLTNVVESYKAKNVELTSIIEGLEVNEKQLKNIIEANSIELRKNHQVIHTLNVDLEQLTKHYEEANSEIHKKESHIDEISLHLKRKCDKLFEYKSKLESIMPDYELLQGQVKERKANIERYKEEIEKLKMEREEAIEVIQDKLNMEEIKNAGLQKQLAELNNRNVVLMTELNELREKYEELQRENTKLERKIRNSTSKIKAETEIEELKDLNKVLQNNLEGASNRITEIQEKKNQALKELGTLKGEYDLVYQENVELKKTLESYKSKQSNQSFSVEEDKYHTMLEERNKTALELEGKKLTLRQREGELEKCRLEINRLAGENKALDKELDDYAQVIRERDAEIATLEHRLDSKLAENEMINQLESKIQQFEKENEMLNNDIVQFRRNMHIGNKQIEELKSQNDKLSKEIKILHGLRKENAELQTQLSDYDNKFDLRSNSSGSRSASPAFETNRRRHSRNELFNQRRQLDNTLLDVCPNENDDNCEALRNKIEELELEIVSKNGKIAALELQIQSESFPYQRKCKDLEEQLIAYHKKNSELKSEVRKLQRAINDVNTWECDICRRWRVNRRDQGCQTIFDNSIDLCSTNSAVVKCHNKIVKLENEKKLMKEVCRSRSRRIKELEKKIEDIEISRGSQVADDMQITDDLESPMVLRSIETPQRKSPQLDTVTYFDKQFDTKNFRPALKENIPANLLDYTKLPNDRRNIWRNN